jgi:hypothetical protein
VNGPWASRSWTSSSGPGPDARRPALQLELEVGQRAGVEQLAQLLRAEQVAQQVAVERQRGGPALGQRRVALVHVDGDPAEQQRRAKGEALAGLDADHPDLRRRSVSTSRSAGRSNTSLQHSRVVSSRIGNVG